MLRIIAALSIAILSSLPFGGAYAEEPEVVTKEDVLTVTEQDRVLGDANAPITMFEFASLSCSHCANFHLNVLPEIKKNYIDTGKVKLIMRDFPLNEQALHASVLAHCAKEDSTFFRLNNAIFRTQSSWAGQKNYLELLGNIGRLAGVSAEEYDSCLQDKDLELRLLTNKYNAAKAFSINATPSFVVNGELYSGGRDYDFFKEEFDELLEE